MERESQEQEAKRRLEESTQQLEKAREEYRAYKFLLKMVDSDLDDADYAFMSGDCKEAWQGVERSLRSMDVNLRDALKLTDVVSPAAEEQLKSIIDRVTNLRIEAWSWWQRIEAESVANNRSTVNPVCPAQLGIAGIDNMLTQRAIDFCIGECPYQSKCDPGPKRKSSVL